MTDSVSSSVKQSIANFSGDAEGEDTSYPHITAYNNGKIFSLAPAPDPTVIQMGDISTIPVRNSAMEAHLNKIAQNLLQHWDGKQPERLGIFISPERSFNGNATPFGDIFVSLRAVDKTASEDELAAVVAHELAHILLEHHLDRKFVKQVTDIGSKATTAYAAASYISRMDKRKIGPGKVEFYLPGSKQAAARNDALSGFGVFAAGLTLFSDIGLSAFDRHQEFEADKFAVMLLYKAGYDPTAMTDVLEHIRTVEAAQEKIEAKARAANISIFNIAAAFSDAIKKDHPSATSRLESVNKQLQKLLGDDIPPERRTKRHKSVKASASYRNLAHFYNSLHEDISGIAEPNGDKRLIRLLSTPYGRQAIPRTMAYSSLKTFSPDTAFKLLSTASNSGSAPMSYYSFLAVDQAARGKGDDAHKTIAAMQRRFAPEASYPVGILAAVSLKDEEWASDLKGKCYKQKDKRIIDACKKASAGESLTSDVETTGGLLDALGSMGNTKNGSSTALASSGQNLKSIQNKLSNVGNVFSNIF
nr:M48 family metallopeptidase [uncultured Cohaesibacter sp.]